MPCTPWRAWHDVHGMRHLHGTTLWGSLLLLLRGYRKHRKVNSSVGGLSTGVRQYYVPILLEEVSIKMKSFCATNHPTLHHPTSMLFDVVWLQVLPCRHFRPPQRCFVAVQKPILIAGTMETTERCLKALSPFPVELPHRLQSELELGLGEERMGEERKEWEEGRGEEQRGERRGGFISKLILMLC